MSEQIGPGVRRVVRGAATNRGATVPPGVESPMPPLDGATAWLNSEPLTTAGLRGKVVLVNFCTYSCINWIRALPYVRAWAEKYRGAGLVVLGVHTPEFGFETDVDKVRRALRTMNVDYPIVLDNDYAIWQAFDNHYWPALYFVDAQGDIRHHHFGEGDYERSETVIQQLLADGGWGPVDPALVSLDPGGVEAQADWTTLKTPETYVGYGRAEGFASPGDPAWDARRVYELAARLRPNQWALAGDWTVGRESAVSNEAGGRIALRFHARDLHLVMGPTTPGSEVRFRVLLDGGPPGASHGIDVDEQGNGVMSEQRLHQLIRQPGTVTEHTFEIVFLDPHAEAFVFTFG